MVTATKGPLSLGAREVNLLLGACKVRRAQLERSINGEAEPDIRRIREGLLQELDAIIFSLSGQANITY